MENRTSNFMVSEQGTNSQQNCVIQPTQTGVHSSLPVVSTNQLIETLVSLQHQLQQAYTLPASSTVDASQVQHIQDVMRYNLSNSSTLNDTTTSVFPPPPPPLPPTLPPAAPDFPPPPPSFPPSLSFTQSPPYHSHPFLYPYSFLPSDFSLHKLISIELTSKNYNLWSHTFLTALEARNKQGFLDGSIPIPDVSEAHY